MTEHEPVRDPPGNPDDVLVSVDWDHAQTLIQRWQGQRIGFTNLLTWVNHRLERLDALRALIALSAPMEELVDRILGTYEEVNLIYVTLDWHNVQPAIQKLASGAVDAAELIRWANCIEGRFDIEYRESTAVGSFIRMISNSSPEYLNLFEIDKLLLEYQAPFGLTTKSMEQGESVFRPNDRRS